MRWACWFGAWPLGELSHLNSKTLGRVKVPPLWGVPAFLSPSHRTFSASDVVFLLLKPSRRHWRLLCMLLLHLFSWCFCSSSQDSIPHLIISVLPPSLLFGSFFIFDIRQTRIQWSKSWSWRLWDVGISSLNGFLKASASCQFSNSAIAIVYKHCRIGFKA